MASGGVIRHTVLLKTASKEAKEKVAASLGTMGKGLHGVKFLSFNVVTDLELVESNADVAVIADFPDKENFLAYASHPVHLGLIEDNKPLVVGRQGMQFTPPKL